MVMVPPLMKLLYSQQYLPMQCNNLGDVKEAEALGEMEAVTSVSEDN
jgi:hypothetical protein